MVLKPPLHERIPTAELDEATARLMKASPLDPAWSKARRDQDKAVRSRMTEEDKDDQRFYDRNDSARDSINELGEGDPVNRRIRKSESRVERMGYANVHDKLARKTPTHKD